eukprot:1442874-Rhodomonas_salina.3
MSTWSLTAGTARQYHTDRAVQNPSTACPYHTARAVQSLVHSASTCTTAPHYSTTASKRSTSPQYLRNRTWGCRPTSKLVAPYATSVPVIA